jgi:hypothetical protein
MYAALHAMRNRYQDASMLPMSVVLRRVSMRGATSIYRLHALVAARNHFATPLHGSIIPCMTSHYSAGLYLAHERDI